jgi:ABC-type transport system involved in multi-copper enzyme maturation permease subunit
VSLYYIITAIEVVVVYGTADLTLGFLKSLLVALLYCASVVSVTFFFSSIMGRSITSTLASFFSLLMVLPIVANVLRIVEVDPWFIVTHSAGLITDIFALPSPFAGSPGPWANYEIFQPEFYLGVTVMVAYALAFMLAGFIVADRKQLG